jgi:hypothetical protein
MQVYQLGTLQLNADERLALRTNGFVASERRGSSTIYKLRFRVADRQKVRYLGCDAAVADAVRAELAAWQVQRRRDRDHRRAVDYARRVIREISIRLAPDVAAAGLRLHGRTIRKPRRGKSNASTG